MIVRFAVVEDVAVMIPAIAVIHVNEMRSRIRGNQVSRQDEAETIFVGAVALLLFVIGFKYFRPPGVIQQAVGFTIVSAVIGGDRTNRRTFSSRSFGDVGEHVPALFEHPIHTFRIAAECLEYRQWIEVESGELRRKQSRSDRTGSGSRQTCADVTGEPIAVAAAWIQFRGDD